MRHLIQEIAEERTVILSTHILSEVQATCDYIRMIEQGRLVFSGTVGEFDSYITPDKIMVSLIALSSLEELSAIPGVVSVEELADMKYRLWATDVQEVIKRVVETSVLRGWQLTAIYPEKSSMDAVFAELSKK